MKVALNINQSPCPDQKVNTYYLIKWKATCSIIIYWHLGQFRTGCWWSYDHKARCNTTCKYSASLVSTFYLLLSLQRKYSVAGGRWSGWGVRGFEYITYQIFHEVTNPKPHYTLPAAQKLGFGEDDTSQDC